MRGEHYILSFILGNILFLSLFKTDLPNNYILHPFPLITITAAAVLLFSKKSGYCATYLTLVAFFMLGGANASRSTISNEIAEDSSGYTFSYLEACRNNILEKYKEKTAIILPDSSSAALILAFTIGDKSYLDPTLKQAYKNSGAMHILALSGLHVGIIFTLIGYLLSFLNFSFLLRRVKLILLCCTILLYAALTGFGASVMRAALMIIMYRIVKASGRCAGKWSTLVYSAAIILLYNPQALFDVGFQLSYSAVAGIIYIYPVIYDSWSLKRGKWQKAILQIWSLCCISVSCQIATLPFAWYYFHTAPHYFLITNMAAVPLVPLCIYSFFFSCAASTLPYIGEISVSITRFLIRGLNEIIMYIGS